MFGISTANVQAATITVNGTGDTIAADGQCTLREAITAANTNAAVNDCPAGDAGADTINFDTAGVFASPQTITLGGTVLEIGGDLTISGTGTGKLTINGNHASRVFHIINGSTVTLDAMTVTGGNVTEGDGNISGGGIYNEEGNLTITNSTVSGNSAPGDAGGICNRGTLTVTNTTISGNSATIGAGGILNTVTGTLTVTNITVSSNLANSDVGGGIYNAGTLAVTNSTVSANSAKHFGGGIYNAATLTVTNSTITRNRVGFNSGDITRGGGISSNNGTEHLTNTIVAGNFKGGSNTPTDIFGVIDDDDHNLIGDIASAGGIVDGVNSNIVGTDPKLGPLVDNGGPTQTHALLFGSPAIDKGTNSGAVSNDQRGVGFARTINDPNVADAADGDGTDIGAVESNYLVVNTTAQDDDGACQPLPGGDCTLREAILAANAAPGTETIVFDIPTADPGYDAVADRYTITLTEELPYLNSDMFINGLGAKRLTVMRGSTIPFRIFSIQSSTTVTIDGLTISGGLADVGGGIKNAGGLTISASVVRDNKTNGGDAATACDDSATPGGDGGGIYNVGSLVIDSSLFTENATGNGGDGGFFTRDDGPPCLKRGARGGDGGAISSSGAITIRNSTFSHNSTGNGGSEEGQRGGRGAAIHSTGSLAIFTTTVFDNRAGTSETLGSTGGSVYSSAPFELWSSIIAGTLGGGPDINGSTFSGTHNITGVDPILGPLQDNGGPTMTHAVLCGSPAIDAGLSGGFPNDQRRSGFARTFDDPAIANAAGSDGTDIGAFELQEALTCNTAPVANDDSYSTNEDTTLNVATPGILDNDTDAEGGPFTVTLNVPPSHGQLTFNDDGSIEYKPQANFNGTDSFVYRILDGDGLESNQATVTITVTPVNDQPVVSATPQTQAWIQYSDAITTINVSASDVETPAANLVAEPSWDWDGDPVGYQTGLPNGLVLGGTGGAWTISGVAAVPKGTYTIRFDVRDTGDGSATPSVGGRIIAIGVTAENAVAAPKASNPVSMQVGSGGSASGTTGQICFDITEPNDGHAGDTSLINAATVGISAVGGGGSGGITAGTVSFMGGGVGTARTTCFTLTMAVLGTPVNVYEVTLTIGGNYYTGSGTTVFTVFDPSSGFVSGGGWIINPNTGYRANYGVNIKYLRSGAAQGSLLYVEHRPGGDYKVKSTSLNSKGGFAIIPITGGAEADIAGKANYVVNDVGTGNYSFIARVIDKGTPGTNDQFGLKLIDPLGQVITGFTFNPVTLGGGNNQVPKK